MKYILLGLMFTVGTSLLGQKTLTIKKSVRENECKSETISSSTEPGTLTINTETGYIDLKSPLSYNQYYITSRRMYGKYVQYKIGPNALGTDAILTIYKDLGYITIVQLNPNYTSEVLVCKFLYLYI